MRQTETKAELAQDSLANNAVSAFAGALLMAQAQAWIPSYGANYAVPFTNLRFSVPSGDAVIIAFAALLLGSSFLFAVASIITPLQSRIRWLTRFMTPILSLLTCLAFLLSYSSVIAELPDEAGWKWILELSGLVMLLFLIFRICKALPRLM